MRILHVVPSLSPKRGGPSFVARALAVGLAGGGLSVDVVTTDDDGAGRLSVPLYEPIHEGGVTYRYFPRQTRFYTASWPLARWLDRNIATYDVVHTHALFSFASLAAAAAARKHQVPYILRPLGTLSRWGMRHRRPLLKRLSFQLFDRHALAGSAAVHYTTEQERAEAAELGVPHRAVVIPAPVTMPGDGLAAARGRFREQYPQLAGRTVALFLSRLDPIKGLDLLIPAFASAHRKHPRLALVVAGAGDEQLVTTLHTLAEHEGVAEQIIWAGFVEGEAKLAALAAADMFVLPSYSESFSIATVEAMAAGLPVILSDQVGVHHEVERAGAGLVVPCESGALAGALGRLCERSELRAEMGRAASALAWRRYSSGAVIDRVEELYASVAGRASMHGVTG